MPNAECLISLIHCAPLRVREDRVDELLDDGGARRPFARRLVRACARTKELVDDVERGDDRDAQRIGTRELARGEKHLFVEIARELADVLRVELAPHGVTMAVNVDVNDA